MLQGFVADFHEYVDAVAVECAISPIQCPLLCDEAFDAAVLMYRHGAVFLRHGEGGQRDENE